MIASLKGRLIAKGEDHVIVEVGGLGFKVHTPTPFLRQEARVGHEVSLFTHLHLREDDVSLYGFESEEEQALFRLLLSVSGVGPKLALAILSTIPPNSFRTAVAQGDLELLSQVPGIGKRTAEKIVLYLKDKVGIEKLVPVAALSPEDREVVEALTALGYTLSEAREAAGSLAGEEMSLEEKVMAAIRYLTREHSS